MKNGLSGSALKLIAVITMFIDHVGAIVIERAMIINSNDYALYERLEFADVILRSVGRIAFPIYCFLLVEGFLHTKNVCKYLLRLVLFAVISEIPFNLAMTGDATNPYYQNIFFSLAIGLCVIICMDLIWKQEKWLRVIRLCLCVFVACIGTFGAELLNVDYGAKGILPIVLFYLFRYNRLNQAVLGVLAFSWEFPAPLAFIPVLSYNGERGRGNKYLFYIFYPLHLTLLYLMAIVLGLS